MSKNLPTLQNNTTQIRIQRAKKILTAERIDDIWEVYYRNPVLFCRKILGYEPYYYNIPVLQCKEPWIAYTSGRQVGKTTTFAAKFLYNALFADRIFKTGEDRALQMICSFTLPQAQIVLRKMRQFARSPYLKPYVTRSIGTQLDIRYIFSPGKTITEAVALGEDGDASRGRTVDAIMIDEYASMKEDAFAAVYPTVSARPNAQLYACGSPKGARGPLHELSASAKLMCDVPDGVGLKNPKEHEWVRFWASSHMNPNRNKKLLRWQKKTMAPDIYRQEYGGEFVGVGSYWYPLDDLYRAHNIEIEFEGATRHIVGVDVSRLGLDRTVIVCLETDGRMCDVVYGEAKDRTTIPDAVRWARDVVKEYGATTLYVEDNGVGGGFVDLGREQIPCQIPHIVLNAENKPGIHRHVADMLSHDKIHIPWDERHTAWKEMTALGKDVRNGKLVIVPDEKIHDDWPAALALACIGVLRESGIHAVDYGVVESMAKTMEDIMGETIEPEHQASPPDSQPAWLESRYCQGSL